MSKVWTPPGAQLANRAAIPADDMRLGDGRMLKRLDGVLVSLPNAEGKLEDTGFTAVAWRTKDHMHILSSIDPSREWGPLLHVSVSRPSTDPSWKDITLVKAAFYGDHLDAMMILPVAADYVNLHPHTFHLWQTPERWGMR